MVIQRSRKWVKDRIPAFICRETSWWVTRWVQCNVFLCPECRKEYRSLKAVWETLDKWQVEEPEVEFESCFLENFRQKYPAAYETDVTPSNASGFWIPRVAYLCAIALLGFAVLWQPQVQRTAVRTVRVETPAIPDTTTPQVAQSPSSPEPSTPVQVAEAPSPEPQPVAQDIEEVAAVAPQWVYRAPSTQHLPTPGAQVRITSTLEPLPLMQDELESPRRDRTVEINDMPVTSGFDSLTQPYQEDRPY